LKAEITCAAQYIALIAGDILRRAGYTVVGCFWLRTEEKEMSRKLLLIAALATALLLTACSSIQDFVVVNKSGVVIEVQYKVKWCKPETPGKNSVVSPPAKLSIEEFGRSSHTWKSLPKEQYRYDDPTCTYTVSVAPGEALLVSQSANYPGHEDVNSEDNFYLESISITGAKGAVRLEGRQAQTHFMKESDDYVLTYE
jgi:hypothetical protein